MKRISLAAIVGAAVLVAALAAWAYLRRSPSTDVVASPTQAAAGLQSAAAVSNPAPSPVPPSPAAPHEATSPAQSPVAPASPNLRKALAEAHDYWAFAHSILPAAQAGDANAQYYLHKVLEHCTAENRMFFKRHGQVQTLDEGLQWAVQRHYSVSFAQKVFDRCHGFLTDDSNELGNATEWLAKATRAGQPIAEATTANKVLLQAKMRDLVNNSPPGQSFGVLAPATVELDSGADPHKLLLDAVKSKDPDVLYTIGESQGLLDPDEADARVAKLAWLLAACQRGLDCSATGVFESCSAFESCATAVNTADMVRSLAAEDWPEVQQRAQVINTRLEAGAWDELGLESPAAPDSGQTH